MKRICSMLLVFGLFSASPAFPKDKKMSTEEVLAKHLESIGTAEARDAIHSIRVIGNGSMTMMLGGSGKLVGDAAFISAGDAFKLSINLGHLNYPEETIVFDGKDGHYAYLVPGERSQIGQFHYQFPQLIRSGLVGGVWSKGWPLTDLKAHKARASYKGIKDVEGMRLHEVSYTIYKAGGFTISLYFDAETFRHVGTVARMKRAANFGPDPLESPRQQELRYRYEEWFTHYREVGGITLPTQWRFRLSIESQNGTMMTEWETNAAEINLNVVTEENTFSLSD